MSSGAHYARSLVSYTSERARVREISSPDQVLSADVPAQVRLHVYGGKQFLEMPTAESCAAATAAGLCLLEPEQRERVNFFFSTKQSSKGEGSTIRARKMYLNIRNGFKTCVWHSTKEILLAKTLSAQLCNRELN
jgi:hypothetical protein